MTEDEDCKIYQSKLWTINTIMYLMQDMVVPCLADKEGNIALDPSNPFLIQVKPPFPSYLKVV